jgi:cellulose synthase/poly-beta-1,6-N-acetylglucosamine synthase-like glycosyltransferase
MVIAALVALVVLVYTYLLYPILIAACARLRPLRIHQDAEHTPTVSAIIPIYNARAYIKEKMDSLLAQDYPPERFEILLCSDCSDDGSDELLAEYAEKYPGRVRVFRADKRSGKPSAMNLMRKQAKGDLLLMTDVRQPLARQSVRELACRFSDPDIGVTSGNLVLKGGTGAGFYWKYENWIRNSEGHFRSMVGATGPIYAIRAQDMADIPSDIILDDMWVPMRVRLAGKRLVFAPEAEAYDETFEDDREFGRKTRTLAGNYQLFAVLPRLLVPFMNPSWFEVFSHKLLRLLCPWALLTLLGLNVAMIASGKGSKSDLEYGFLQGLLIGQVLFYLLALMGGWLGKLGNVARTFVVLNYAAMVGLWRFVRHTQRITW